MRRQMLLCILGPIIAWFAGSIGVAMIETFFTIAAKAVGTREVYMLCQMIVSLLSFAIYILLETGLTIFFLRIARGQEADLGDIFRGVRCFGHICGSNILTQLGVSIGMLFFLVPGVIVALMLSQHKFLVIDRKLGILDSLTVSSRLTYGNKLNLLVLWAAASLIYLAGALACFVGLLVALPLVHLMMTVAYLTLSGQPFGESRGKT